MTKDEIMALAEKVGLTGLSLIDIAYLESFAELVSAAEREACFKIAITIGDHGAGCRHTDEVAAAILARGGHA